MTRRVVAAIGGLWAAGSPETEDRLDRRQAAHRAQAAWSVPARVPGYKEWGGGALTPRSCKRTPRGASNSAGKP